MESVRDHLDAVVATGVPGVVVVAVGPGGRVEAAAGVADARTGEALSVGHRFRIGSVTKIFVAAHIFVGSKAPSHEILDDLPQRDEY